MQNTEKLKGMFLLYRIIKYKENNWTLSMEAVQADFHEIHYLSPHILTSFYTKDPPDQLKKTDSFYSNVNYIVE